MKTKKTVIFFLLFCGLAAGASAGEIAYRYDISGRLVLVDYNHEAGMIFTYDAAHNISAVKRTTTPLTGQSWLLYFSHYNVLESFFHPTGYFPDQASWIL